VNSKASWWDQFIHGMQHTVFRGVSIVFSSVSAVAIYWLFGGFGTNLVRHYTALAMAVVCAVLGYFVSRGLAHRLMNKQRIRAYVFVMVLYEFVEVVANFGQAVADFPSFTWVQQLVGWEHMAFSILVPLVLSITPLFNVSLAYIDMDLMLEKGVRLVSGAAASVGAVRGGLGVSPTASTSRVQPKNAQQPMMPTAPAQQPQAALPPNPPPPAVQPQGQVGGVPNNLKNHYGWTQRLTALMPGASPANGTSGN